MTCSLSREEYVFKFLDNGKAIVSRDVSLESDLEPWALRHFSYYICFIMSECIGELIEYFTVFFRCRC